MGKTIMFFGLEGVLSEQLSEYKVNNRECCNVLKGPTLFNQEARPNVKMTNLLLIHTFTCTLETLLTIQCAKVRGYTTCHCDCLVDMSADLTAIK